MLKINITGNITWRLTLAFINLKYGMYEDFYFEYGLLQGGTQRFPQDTLYIKNKKMYEDPEVRSILLEYLI